MARKWIGVVLAAQLGCYTYAPATLETTPAGTPVRALITPEAERQLLVSLGVQQGRILSGELQANDGGQITLLIPSVPVGSGPGSHPLYQQVTLAATDVLRVDVRRVDPVRTGVLAVGAVAVAAGIVYQALGPGFFQGTPGGGGPPESERGWVLRIPVAWP